MRLKIPVNMSISRHGHHGTRTAARTARHGRLEHQICRGRNGTRTPRARHATAAMSIKYVGEEGRQGGSPRGTGTAWTDGGRGVDERRPRRGRTDDGLSSSRRRPRAPFADGGLSSSRAGGARASRVRRRSEGAQARAVARRGESERARAAAWRGRAGGRQR
jgi:hypothetical protein